MLRKANTTCSLPCVLTSLQVFVLHSYLGVNVEARRLEMPSFETEPLNESNIKI